MSGPTATAALRWRWCPSTAQRSFPARESDAVMGQLVCFVANQWKKHFDQPAERVVCRLSDTLFAIGCADRTRRELEEG